MATDNDFMEFVAEQVAVAGDISFRKMFGEYALYCNGKVVALVCDNQVFVKPTEAGRSFIGDEAVEAPAYPGAKNSFLVGDRLDDREWMAELLRITCSELPEPKPKRSHTGRGRKKKTS